MGSQGNNMYQKRQSKPRGTGASTNHSQFVNQLEDAQSMFSNVTFDNEKQLIQKQVVTAEQAMIDMKNMF